MRTRSWMLAGAMALGTAPAIGATSGDGLQVGPERASWARWQGRLMLGLTSSTLRSGEAAAFEPSPPQLGSVSVLGDYYLGRAAGGLRATSGVLFGNRPSLSGGLSSGSSFTIDRRTVGIPTIAGDHPPEFATVPYVGVGYTGFSAKGGWGLSADVGVMALTPRSAVRLGGTSSASDMLDDKVRELRLTPIIQLGVSYSF